MMAKPLPDDARTKDQIITSAMGKGFVEYSKTYQVETRKIGGRDMNIFKIPRNPGFSRISITAVNNSVWILNWNSPIDNEYDFQAVINSLRIWK